MIDLRRLHVLRAVAHYGTVTAAAEALHFTPSAASQQIRQLGKDLGVALLEPHGRRVRLTPSAQLLLRHADAIEARWEQAEIDLHGWDDQPAGLLRVCSFPSAISNLLTPLAVTLQERHPALTVQIEEVERRDSFDLLFDGDADLAVTEAASDNPPLRDARFDQQPLLDDPFDLLVPSAHPLAGRRRIGLEEASGERWIVSTAVGTCREQTFTACIAAGFTPDIAHNALEWHAIATMVAGGLGVALVPRLAHLAPHLPVRRVQLTGNPRPARKLLTCTRAGARGDATVVAALDELSRIATEVCLDPVPA